MEDGENKIKEIIYDFRHDIHMHPELSKHEYRTTALIKEKLTAHGVEIIDFGLKTGLVAEIRGRYPGPLIVLRGDIDALPIDEQSNSPFKSVNKGVMHACGHDLHSAITLGAALLLKKEEEKLEGTVRILFQAAEETGSGALEMIECGVLKDAGVIFGIHNDPNLPLGFIGTKKGWLTANTDRFDVRVYAKGCHAGKPYEGVDPIIIASQLISALQTIISRNVPSSDNVVLSITQIHSGDTWNVIPGDAYMEGTVRTFGPSIRFLVQQRIAEIIRGFEASFCVRIEFGWYQGPPSVTNNSQWVDICMEKAKEMGFKTEFIEATPIGEDFGFFQEKIPGVFIMLGSDSKYPLHHPKYEVKDDVLWPASRYYAELAMSCLSFLKERVDYERTNF